MTTDFIITDSSPARTHQARSPRTNLPTSFHLCCLKRHDRPDEPAKFHFHESNGLSHNRREFKDMCTNGDGRIYEPIEFATEAAKCKVIRDMERFRQMRPFLEQHKVAIEQELMKVSEGKYPPPHSVMDKLMEPVVLDDNFNDGYSKPKPKSRITDRSVTPKIPNMSDILNTPLYRMEIWGETQIDAYLQTLPQPDIDRLIKLSKTEENVNFNKNILLEMTLSRAAKVTELEYNFNLLDKAKNLADSEVTERLKVGKQSYLVMLAMVGRQHMYDYVLKKVSTKRVSKHLIAKHLFKKCLRLANSIDVLRQIMHSYIQHKQMFTRLCEIGIEQTKAWFDPVRTQQLIDFFLPIAQKLYRLLSHSVKNKFLPLQPDEPNII